MKKQDKNLFMSIHDEMGLTYPTAMKYCREKKYPEHIALAAERLTNGKLKASMMCPDTLGRPLPSHRYLASQCLAMFENGDITGANGTFLASVLTFLEEQQFDLYQSLISRIESDYGDRGKEFAATREAHRGNF